MSQMRLWIAGLLLTAAVVCPAQVTCFPSGHCITEHPLAAAASGHPASPNRIVAGPDGNLWITEAGRITRMTTAGLATGYRVAGQAVGITVGPDRNLWYASNECCGGSKIGRITPAGAITEFAAPGLGGGFDITAGPDGNLWFTEVQNIARMTTAGLITAEFPSLIPSIYSVPNHITAGPDGNLWFTEGTFGGIGKITTAGVVTKYEPPPGGITGTTAVTTGPDGNIWFADADSGSPSVKRITPAGVITRFAVPANMNIYALTVAPDGNLWFSGQIFTGPGVGRITPNATGGLTFDFFLSPTNFNGAPYYGIVAGPDGNLWFTEGGAGKIGKVTLPGPRVISVSSTSADGVYGPGANIPITLTFSSAVVVTGTPKMILNSGGVATYTSGSGTNTLTFTYAVGAGQSTSRLDPASHMALVMNLKEATIRDNSGTAALLTVPVYPLPRSLGTNRTILITPAIGCTLPFCVLPLKVNSGGNNGTVTTEIDGAGFIPGATVKLVRGGQTIIANPAIVRQSGTKIIVTFDLHGTALGPWEVVVTNPDVTSVSLPAGFTVVIGSGPQVWADVIGRSTIRQGTEEIYTVIYGNRGDVDARGVAVWLAGIPTGSTVTLINQLTPPPQQAGEAPIDWDQLPILVDYTTLQPTLNCTSQGSCTPGMPVPLKGRGLPLLAPLISPGATLIFQVKLKVTEDRPFRLYAWGGRPAFQSPLDDAWEACLKKLPSILLDGIGVFAGIKGDDAAKCSVEIATLTAGILQQITDLASNDEKPKLYSLLLTLLSKYSSGLSSLSACTGVAVEGQTVGRLISYAQLVLEDIPPCGECLGEFWASAFLPVTVVASRDPNDKVGSSGNGGPRFATSLVRSHSATRSTSRTSLRLRRQPSR